MITIVKNAERPTFIPSVGKPLVNQVKPGIAKLVASAEIVLNGIVIVVEGVPMDLPYPATIVGRNPLITRPE